MDKPRPSYGRSRFTPRAARRAPPAVDHEAAQVLTARRVATAFVATRWPELARVSPTVTARRVTPPSDELLARLGLDRLDLACRPGGLHYVFVFSGTRHTPDGAESPLVATVTVDDQLRIVKTSETR